MSTATFDRVKRFLDERSAMRGIDQNDIAVLHGGDDTRKVALTTRDLRELLAEVVRLREMLREPANDCTHRCVKCLHGYTPVGVNEDCPRCGCDGTK